jgi:septum site-determining protein MinC
MISCGIKCSYESFEYFLLQINSIHDVQYIETKLLNIKKLGNKHNYVVLGFDKSIDNKIISKIIIDVNDLATKHNIILHSILENENITVDSFNGVPVINFSNGRQIKSLDNINQTLIISEPVRSGIQVKNDGDIIITAFVSDNAEIIASGNIHVYGEARGRLIAGSNGDKKVKIFVTKFNPELISIGGIFRTIENKLPDGILNKSVMVSLDEKEHLSIVQL